MLIVFTLFAPRYFVNDISYFVQAETNYPGAQVSSRFSVINIVKMAGPHVKFLPLVVLWLALFFNPSSCLFQEHHSLGDGDVIALTDTDARNLYQQTRDSTPWWTFSTSVGRRIRFHFRRFYWGLSIGDGLSVGSNTRLAYFYSNSDYQPSDVVSISNDAWLGSPGTRDYYNTCSSCYFTVDITSIPVPDATLLEEGIDFPITSPNYPNNYPYNAFQLWEMRVPEGQSVMVTVEHFHTYNSNYYALFFGDGEDTFSIGSNRWKRFSGVQEADSLEAELTPETSSFKIIFSSACCNTKQKGFSIRMCAFSPHTLIADCPTDITETSNSGTTVTSTWTPPTAIDHCRPVTLSSDHSPGDSFAFGTTTVTYTATDASGNSETCLFDVTVEDFQEPVISDCPADKTENSNSGATVIITWTPPTATDNSGQVTIISDYSPGDSFTIGTTRVTYAARDASGNAATCSFLVTVVDSQEPIISHCPLDITEHSNSGTTVNITWTPPTVTDNSREITLTSDYSPGDSFTIGTARVTYTATDASGNTATCSFHVTVVDSQKPIISNCPANKTENSNSRTTVNITWIPPTATDNSRQVTLTSNYIPGDSFTIGTSKVTYTARDAAGNAITCSFYVTVVDSQKPIISDCPANKTDHSSSGTTAVITWTPPTATDNSGQVTLTSNYSPGYSFVIGTTRVTYTARDASGNAATCSFHVKVVDSRVPIITDCPTDITEHANLGSTSNITWTPPNVSHSSEFVSLTSNHSPGDSFAIGTTRVTYTAMNSVGNTAACSFNVAVVDSQLPILNDCPTDIIEYSSYGTAVNIKWTPPSTTDNSREVTLTWNCSPGDPFAIGTTTVTYTATDLSGNTQTCSFNVTVVGTVDAQKPIINDCPTDITENSTYGTTIFITWTPPTATDNAREVSLTWDYSPGDSFAIGTTVVTYTATDPSGNTATCLFHITVVEVSRCDGDSMNCPLGTEKQCKCADIEASDWTSWLRP